MNLTEKGGKVLQSIHPDTDMYLDAGRLMCVNGTQEDRYQEAGTECEVR